MTPQILLRRDGTIVERIQRWLIDNGDSYSMISKALNNYSLTSQHSNKISKEVLYEFLDDNLFVASIRGQFFFFLVSSMIFRAIELFCQSTKHPLNFTTLSPRIKGLMNLFIIPAMAGFGLFLGYFWEDIFVFIFLPILVENFLSFTWANYFKQINALSGTKDFVLKDFLFKIIYTFLLRIIPVIISLLVFSNNAYIYNSAKIIICPTKTEKFILNFFRASSRIVEVFLETLALILGKTSFDLIYIFIFKMFAKNTDLRDPMGWIFSKFRLNSISHTRLQAIMRGQKNKKTSDLDSPVKPLNQKKVRNVILETNPTNIESSEKDYPTKNQKTSDGKKEKIKTRKLGHSSSIENTNSTLIKSKNSINFISIEIGGRTRSFQKIEDTSFNKEVWAVIIADSTERQKLTKYERLLSNGSIGGGVRQLTGWSDRYEIGANMKSRLIGKMYDSGVYHSLQNFMRMEEALQLSQELETHGIPDNVSLIVFSAEAKTHDDIFKVAKKI